MKQLQALSRSAARIPAILLVGTLLAGAPFAAVLGAERAMGEPLSPRASCATAAAETCGQAAMVDVPELDDNQQAQLGELAARAALADSRAFSVLRALRQSSTFATVPHTSRTADSPDPADCAS